MEIVGNNVVVIPKSISKEDKLIIDINFGDKLIKQFLLDNRNIVPAISSIDSLNLMNKFQNIEKLARLGDIKTIRILLSNLEIDDIFTQERKDIYLSMIDEHLSLK